MCGDAAVWVEELVYGDADVLTPPKHQARFVEKVSGAEAVVLAGVGHMLPWEDPAGLARALEGWPANG